MENSWSNGKMKVLKSRPSNENIPPLLIDSDERRGRYLQPTAMSARFQPYNENIDASLPLARYLFAGSPLSGKVAAASEAFISSTFGARTAKALQYCGNSSGGSSSFGSRGRLSPSPLSSIENMEIASLMSPPMYRTPATGDDDVIVMDDILVRPMSGGKSGRSSSSSGRGSSSSSKSVLKTDICRGREESGNCRYNSKCQTLVGRIKPYRNLFVGCEMGRKKNAILKEIPPCLYRLDFRGNTPYIDALRLNGGRIGFPPDHFSKKILCEQAQTSESSVGAGSSTPGQSSHFAHQQHASADSDPEVASQSDAHTSESSIGAGSSTQGPSNYIAHQQHAVDESNPEVVTSQPTSPEPQYSDWSPLDDRIKIVLPGSDKVPSRKEVDAYISRLQHGRTSKRRLPVFGAICEGD
ncbi:hypothetical protein VNO78_11490 [Psophocarpus tetragonolobus]|uniref:Uncharacterized protein n=1 Tax=Psophocarpus tetragonolobus TaxID=3891 RepID=A0AAN9XNH5_PSOTE